MSFGMMSRKLNLKTPVLSVTGDSSKFNIKTKSYIKNLFNYNSSEFSKDKFSNIFRKDIKKIQYFQKYSKKFLKQNSYFVHDFRQNELNSTYVNEDKTETEINKLNQEKPLFNENEIESIFNEVNNLFESHNKNSGVAKKFEIKADKFFLDVNDLKDEVNDENLDAYDDILFSYTNDHYSFYDDYMVKFPHLKKLVFIYQTIFITHIKKFDYKFLIYKIFKTEDFNINDLNDLKNYPLELKMAYFVGFNSIRSMKPFFLEEHLEKEICDLIDSKKVSLNDILVFSKLNYALKSLIMSKSICNYLTPIFEKSITEKKIADISDKDITYFYFFQNLLIIIPQFLQHLDFVISQYENTFINILTTIYNMRECSIKNLIDLSPAKLLLLVIDKISKNQRLKSTEIYKKFLEFIDELPSYYREISGLSKIESAQISKMVNLFNDHYAIQKVKNEDKIQKILELNLFSLKYSFKFQENSVFLAFKSIESFVRLFDEVKDIIEENEELTNLMQEILFCYFKSYSPNILTITNKFMKNMDFSSIKNIDLIFLIKLKYMFSLFFPRTNEEANSIIIIMSNFINYSLDSIEYYPIIYSVMGKCSKNASITDKKKIFEFYKKNFTHYINDDNFILFMKNFAILDKYGNFSEIITEYKQFIIRQLIKMLYYDQIYYIFTVPERLLINIMSFCDLTHFNESEELLSKSFKKRVINKKEKEKAQDFIKIEETYNPNLSKEIYRFLKKIFEMIKNDKILFMMYSQKILAISELTKMAYLNNKSLINEYYFTSIEPVIYFVVQKLRDEKEIINNLSHIILMTYYISFLEDSEKIMVNQLKYLAKMIIIAENNIDDPTKLTHMYKKFHQLYCLNPYPYDQIQKSSKYPKFFSLFLRKKDKNIEIYSEKLKMLKDRGII